MIDLHVRDGEHVLTLDQALLREWVAAVRESSSLVVQLSTGGSVHDPLDERLKVLDAEPDSCSLTMGTTNFGDDVFLNPWPFVKDLYQLALERGVAPEFELSTLARCTRWAVLSPRTASRRRQGRRRLREGRPGGVPGAARHAGRRRRLPPEVTSWSATASAARPSPSPWPPCRWAGTCGSGWRTCPRSSRGAPVESNAQLVARAVDLGAIAQRTPMTPARVPGARSARGKATSTGACDQQSSPECERVSSSPLGHGTQASTPNGSNDSTAKRPAEKRETSA